MFERALQTIVELEPNRQNDFIERLEYVRHEGCTSLSWRFDVGSDMGELMAEYGFAEE